MSTNTNSENDTNVRIHNGRMGGEPIFLGAISSPPPIVYGQRLTLNAPNVEPNGATNVEIAVELSPDGYNQWTHIDPKMVLPVSGDGCFLRYRATTELGTSVTEATEIHINKADYDMEDVHWKELDNTAYDGMLKIVKLEGLPEGVEVEYSGNKAYTVGDYVATAVLKYDERNYNAPAEIVPFEWSVTKAKLDVSNIEWVYDEPFMYNEMEHVVRLTGVPNGIKVNYTENEARDAGEYVAVAEFSVEIENFEDPELKPMTLDWEIKPAKIDLSKVRWQEKVSFSYDGEIKKIEVNNLPDRVFARYECNEATDAGEYIAAAYFYHEEEDNYEVADALVTKWRIERAHVDLSQLSWDYEGPFKYDGGIKSANLTGIPKGVEVNYLDNAAVNAGDYRMTAHFVILNEKNYYPIQDITRDWKISKADYDMSEVQWDYENAFYYDGEIRSVYLTGLPEGLTAEYVNASAADAGTYEAEAIFNYDDRNYNAPSFGTCKWGIIPSIVDTKEVNWATKDKLIYNGSAHTIYLTGLPDYIICEYTGNIATDAGAYYATAKLSSISPNYIAPTVDDCSWKIAKARWNFDDLEWNVTDEHSYDGSYKRAFITNVPYEFEAKYIDNEKCEAGKYLATATLKSRSKNVEEPEPFTHVWEIRKADYDMSQVRWRYSDATPYTGQELYNELENLPETVYPIYRNNVATDAGSYVTEAYFEVKDSKNYNVPDSMYCNWSINKAIVDISNLNWVGDLDSTYDGSVKSVKLEGIPENVNVKYVCNEASAVGVYECVAVLQHQDSNNYEELEPQSIRWTIRKGVFDLSNVRWDYKDAFDYDGTPKSIELVGLPEDVEVIYEGTSATAAGEYLGIAAIIVNAECLEKPYIEPIKWEIKKLDYDMSNTEWVELKDMVYDGGKKGVWLVGYPDALEPVYEGNVEVNAGEYRASATFNNVGDNYNLPTVPQYEWSVQKAPITEHEVSWETSEPFVYDGNEHGVELKTEKKVHKTKKGLFSKTEINEEVLIIGLPDGMTMKTENDRATEPGEYTAKAYVCPADDDVNHTLSAPIEYKWEITKETEIEE